MKTYHDGAARCLSMVCQLIAILILAFSVNAVSARASSLYDNSSSSSRSTSARVTTSSRRDFRIRVIRGGQQFRSGNSSTSNRHTIPSRSATIAPLATSERIRIGKTLAAPLLSAIRPAGVVTTTTVITYTYDPLNHLTDATYSDGQSFQYAYDQIGNRIVQTTTITSTQVTNYVYDAANRLASVNGQPYTWDDNGNLVSDGATEYAYDQANRLISATLGTTITLYAYNADGARLKQVVNGSPTTYTLDLAAPLAQVLVAEDSGDNTHYLYGMMRIGEQQSSGWVYHLVDALGSVRQLADVNAQVVLAQGYTPYGGPLWSQGTGQSAYGFTGEAVDVSTGLVFLRARHLQPKLGMFLSHDPWSGDALQPGSMNGWNYGEENPVSNIDPSGNSIAVSCFPPNRLVKDPVTGRIRCVSPFGIVIGEIGVGTQPGTGDPTSELLKWLIVAGLEACVDIVTDIIRDQDHYDPQIIVELGAGDYKNAERMSELFPMATVIATNSVADWELGKLFKPLGINNFNTEVYDGFERAKAKHIVVGDAKPIENNELVQRRRGEADLVYTIYPYPSKIGSFAVAAEQLLKDSPGTMAFMTAGVTAHIEAFLTVFYLRNRPGVVGKGPVIPFGLNASFETWGEIGPDQTGVFIQTGLRLFP